MPKSINCKIIVSKPEKTEIEVEGQRLLVPTGSLPETGDKKTLKLFFVNTDEAIPDKQIAKTILEEILNGK